MSNFFVGAHGTGKSTLIDLLKQLSKSKDYFLCEGVSRPIIRSLEIAEIAVTDTQRQILVNELTSNQYQTLLANSKSLCTRSILDIIAYSAVVYPHINITKYKNLLFETKDKINHLFYTPIEFDLKVDAERKGIWGDPQVQKDIDTALKNLLTEFSGYIKGEVVTVTGSVDHRVDTILKYL